MTPHSHPATPDSNAPLANLPDVRIDRVLHALGSAQPAPGLESRIAVRIAYARAAQANAPRSIVNPVAAARSLLAALLNPRFSNSSVGRSVSAPGRLYPALAAIVLLSTLAAISLSHRRAANPAASYGAVANPTHAQAAEPTPKPGQNIRMPAHRGFSPGSPTPRRNTGILSPASFPQPATDPDAVALAETRAPSRPAPPMPLTPQERLLLAATRQGQPIEVAELDIARAPALRAASEARETAGIQRLAGRLFAPIAFAEALEPSTPSPHEHGDPAPAPSPSSSNTLELSQ